MSQNNVIHLRLDDETLLSVLEMYSMLRRKASTHQMPVATRVSHIIEEMMMDLRASGQIPQYRESDILRELAQYMPMARLPVNVRVPGFKKNLNFNSAAQITSSELTSQEPDPIEDGEDGMPERDEDDYEIERSIDDASSSYPDEQERSELLETLSSAEDPRAILRSLIEQGIESVTEPHIELDPNVFLPDPDDLPEPEAFVLNIQEQPKIPVAELARYAATIPDVASAAEFLSHVKDRVTASEVIAAQITAAVMPKDNWFGKDFTLVYSKTLVEVKRYIAREESLS